MSALGELHRRIATIAVTGTNGKTTTTSMIASIVAASGEPWARITTLGACVAGEDLEYDGSMAAFERAVARAAGAGVRTLALEVTSRALMRGFARTWPARIAVFTNLTRDHLDYHASAEEYLAAKAQLFVTLPRDGSGVAVLNARDPSSELIAQILPAEVAQTWYSVIKVSDTLITSGRVLATRDGMRVELESGELADAVGGVIELGVLGDVHAENALGAAVACWRAGYSGDAIKRGLAEFRPVPGRFEPVSRRPLVVVDYAHTPDGLEGTLRTARSLVAAEGGRVIVVFGCGGDRDRGKRPQMGRIADQRADVVVLTNDNPRSEDPETIADEVFAGVSAAVGAAESEPRARWVRELDRARAIEIAIGEAKPDDVVVIAGKGHEQTQQIGDRLVPFSDAEVARRIISSRSA